MRTRPPLKSLFIGYFVCMTLINIFLLFGFSNFTFKGYNDFAAFYTAGTIVKEGQSRYLYDPELQWKAQRQFAPEVESRKGPLPYLHPAFEAWLFLPLAYLGYAKAYMVWTAAKIMALVFAIFLLMPACDRKTRRIFLLGLLSIGLFPIALDLLQGQDSILLLLIFAACFSLFRRGRDFWAGCCLALGLFKFHLVLPIAIVFLLRRKYRVMAGFTIISLFLISVTVAMTGWSGVLDYPKLLLALDRTPGTGVTNWQYMPSARGVLTWLVTRAVPSQLAWWFIFVEAAGIVLATMLWMDDKRTGPTAKAISFSITIIASLLCNFYVYAHDMALLLIPMVLLGTGILKRLELSGWPRGLFFAGSLLLSFSPAWWWLLLHAHGVFLYGFIVLCLFGASLIRVRQQIQELSEGWISSPDLGAF